MKLVRGSEVLIKYESVSENVIVLVKVFIKFKINVVCIIVIKLLLHLSGLGHEKRKPSGCVIIFQGTSHF